MSSHLKESYACRSLVKLKNAPPAAVRTRENQSAKLPSAESVIPLNLPWRSNLFEAPSPELAAVKQAGCLLSISLAAGKLKIYPPISKLVCLEPANTNEFKFFTPGTAIDFSFYLKEELVSEGHIGVIYINYDLYGWRIECQI